MGIRKKLILASLVSMMMILAFTIGFVPSHRAPSVDAADDGQVDMADLLGAMLGLKALEAPVITSPPDGVTFMVPAGGEAVWLRVNAEPPLTSDSAEYIALGIDGMLEPSMGGAYAWRGYYGDILFDPPYTLPYPMSLEFTKLTLDGWGEAHWVYAFAEPWDLGGGDPPLNWLCGENLMTVHRFYIQSVPPGWGDDDLNGIPDHLTYAVGPGEIWTSRNPSNALVLVANLNMGAAKGMYDLDGPVLGFENVQVMAPSREQLDIPAEDDAFIIVSLGEDVSQVLGDVDVGGLADAITDKQPGGVLGVAAGTFAQYVEISIVYNRADDGRPEDFQEIAQLPGEFPVVLTMEGIDATDGTGARFLSYPTDVSTSEPLVFSVSDADEWSDENPWDTIGGGSMTVALTSLSLFAPFSPPLELTGVNPTIGPVAGGNSVMVLGAFPIDAAADAYNVFFGGNLAAYDDVPDVITADTIYVKAPAHAAGTVDIRVADAINAAQSIYLEDAYTYVPPPDIVNIDPRTGSTGGGDIVTITGTALGTVTQVLFDTTEATIELTGDTRIVVTTAAHSAGTVDVTVDAGPYGSDIAPGAFTYEAQGRLIIAVEPLGSGLTSPLPGTYSYPVDEVVSITAGPIAGRQFDHWEVDGVDMGTVMPLEVTIVEGDTSVTAYFAPSTLEIVLDSVVPDAGPIAGGNGVQILGAFPVATVLTIAEADAAYGVYFNEARAAFGVAAKISLPVVRANVMYVIAPAHEAGTVDIRVEDAINPPRLDELQDAYTYVLEPSLSAIDPDQGPKAGGTPVTITGNALATAMGVYFGSVSAATAASDLVIDSDTQIRALTPPYPTTDRVDVIAITAGGAASLPDGFKYTENYFTLTTDVSPPGSGTVDPSGVLLYAPNTQVSVSATANADWVFSHWTVNGADSGWDMPLEVTMDADKTVIAVFVSIDEARTLTTAVSPIGSGTINPAAGTHVYPKDRVVTITATANAGWAFDHWTVNGADGGSAMPLNVTMDVDKTVTAMFIEFEVREIIPSLGPIDGGNAVKIVGTFPVISAIETVAEAAAAYSVYFYTSTARGDLSFDDSSVPQVVTADAIYAIVPPWDGPATVNIRVKDLANPACFADLADAYTYTDEYFTLTTAVSPIGSGAIDPPAGEYYYAVDTVVSVTAAANAGWTFSHWTVNGADSGSAMPLEVTMNEDKAVTAVFVGGDTYTLTTAVSPPGSGIIDPTAGVHVCAAGAVVPVMAVANAGWAFSHWTVNGADSGSAMPLLVTMNEDKTVTAVFGGGVTYTLTTAVEPAGSGTIDPAAGEHVYPAGDVVSVTATAASADWVFSHWTVNGADSGWDMPLEVTMDADKTVTAFFVTSAPGVLPNWAWLFGGVVASVTGGEFTAESKVTFAGVEADVVKWTPAQVLVVVPPLSDTGTADTVTVTVSATDPALTCSEDFTYYRHRTEDGVTMTAFLGDATSTISATIEPDATLTLPSVADKTDVYGLVRASVTPDADLSTDVITADLGDDTVIADVWGFDVHLYEAAELDPSWVAADMAYAEIDDWAYESSDENPGQLDFSVDDTDLTIADVKTGLSLWSVAYGFDYVSLEAGTAGEVAYHSMLLANEVEPALEADSEDDDAITEVSARLYSLGALSLRVGALLPEGIFSDVVLDPTSADEGPVAGGTTVILYSAKGGLGYTVDKVGFGTAGATKAFAPIAGTIDEPRTSQFRLEVLSPEAPEAGTVDVLVHPKALEGVDVDPVVIKDAFTYTEEGLKISPLVGLLALLALLALGGDGGDDGPCFIATAAYGTPLAAEIDTLRALRDTYLLDNAAGAAFVDMYYRVSPAVATIVAKSPVLAAAVRLALVPVIWSAKLLLALPAPSVLLAVAIAGMAVLLARRRRGHRRA